MFIAPSKWIIEQDIKDVNYVPAVPTQPARVEILMRDDRTHIFKGAECERIWKDLQPILAKLDEERTRDSKRYNTKG